MYTFSETRLDRNVRFLAVVSNWDLCTRPAARRLRRGRHNAARHQVPAHLRRYPRGPLAVASASIEFHGSAGLGRGGHAAQRRWPAISVRGGGPTRPRGQRGALLQSVRQHVCSRSQFPRVRLFLL